jgi:hypothetical protein
MANRTIPLAKRILYFSIMIVLLLVVFELISRAYYYQYLSKHPVAFVQLLKDVKHGAQALVTKDTALQRVKKSEALLRPGLPKSETDRIAAEQAEANSAVFKPWVEFAFRDYHGKYLNVTDHIRRSDPDRSDTAKKDPFCIYFLGGSTTYGFDLTDEETIPSAFVRAYRQGHPAGRPIRVVNLGMPFYYSYQELIQLADLLFKDKKPDMVIMLDGLNDCIAATDSYKRIPAFAIGNDGSFRAGTIADEKKMLEDFRDLPGGMPADSAYRAVCEHYLDNIRNAHQLAGLSHIPVYCFWQPVPYYNYTNRQNDPICTHARSERFERIYTLVKSRGVGLPYFFFLGDMLQDETGLPFIDQIHYSPRFSQAIAQKMLSLIKL